MRRCRCVTAFFPVRRSGQVRNWTPVGTVALHPEFDCIVKAHSEDRLIQPPHDRGDNDRDARRRGLGLSAKIVQNRPFSRLRSLPVMPLPLASNQLLLCVSPDWATPAGRLQRFLRAQSANDWQPVGPSIPVMLGRSGLAWGRGLPAEPAGEVRLKSEGDGCAPAGIFVISALFGYAKPGSTLAHPAKLPYLYASPDLKAIDDPASSHYNRIVDQSSVACRDWTSCEDMRRDDQRYAIGAVVAHNLEQAPGAGSCIFLHVWEREGVPTAGCTAMSLADMTEIARWLDGAAAPVLVQLPRAEYEALREAWGLPLFAA